MKSLAMSFVGVASILYLYRMHSRATPAMAWIVCVLILIMITPNN